jgi:hypothetical protein
MATPEGAAAVRSGAADANDGAAPAEGDASGRSAVSAPAEPVIDSAEIVPGHDGAAELLVRVRYGADSVGSVTLDAAAAARLMERCGVGSVPALAGASWRHLTQVLEGGAGGPAPSHTGDAS